MFIKREETELQTKRKLQKAGALLGFSKNQAVTADMVRKRFTELVKGLHPDTSVTGITAHPYQIDAIRKAKDLLLKHMESDDA